MIVITITRKPLDKDTPTVATNALKWGCGGINVGDSRIGTEDRNHMGSTKASARTVTCVPSSADPTLTGHYVGRWPANLILSEEAARELDVQSGISSSPTRDSFGGGTGQIGSITGPGGDPRPRRHGWCVTILQGNQGLAVICTRLTNNP